MLSSPDDDGPRLVYADVLQERGDARGEFIPLQCELVKWSVRADASRFQAMRERERELLAEHGQEWVDQAIPFRCDGFFRRGFVEELQCLPGAILHRGLEVVAPVRVLRLEGDTSAEVAQRVMALPLGARVRELTLRLVDSPIDGSLRAAGAGLSVLKQLSADANTIELLDQLGWLARLRRLDLPLTPDGGALLDDLARFKPKQLAQLRLTRQAGAMFGRDILTAIRGIWAELPSLTIRWRGVDYLAADEAALAGAFEPFRVQTSVLAPAVAMGALNLVLADSPDGAVRLSPMAFVPLPKAPPTTDPWDRWLKPEKILARGFLPRAIPQAVTLIRAEENAIPVLVAVGPADTFGAVPFAEDIARLMALPRVAGLMRVERTAMLEHARWAIFESFEGVSLWELNRLHPRLPPGLVLKILGEAALAGSHVPGWRPTADDVLIDALGRVRLLPGFPGTTRAEEPSYTGREEVHPLGEPPPDDDPGGVVFQLGTALFELLTGTALFGVSGRLVLVSDRLQLSRWLDQGGLSLARVDSALASFDPLFERALTHAHSKRFAGLAGFGDALLAHEGVASTESLALVVQAAVGQVARTRDGR